MTEGECVGGLKKEKGAIEHAFQVQLYFKIVCGA
jgi:hypothetical protein